MLPPANWVTDDHRSLCLAQELVHGHVKLSDASAFSHVGSKRWNSVGKDMNIVSKLARTNRQRTHRPDEMRG